MQIIQAYEPFLIYGQSERGHALETQKKYRDCFSSWILPRLGHLEIERITRLDLLAFRQEFVLRKLSVARQYSLLMCLKTFLKFCRTVLKVECIDPAEITLPNRGRPHVLILNDREIGQVLEATDVRTFSGLRLRALIELILATGVRLSEALSLNRLSFDRNDDEIDIIGKGAKPRSIFLNSRSKHWVGRYLQTRCDDNPALFITTGSFPNRWAREDISRFFVNLSRKAAIGKKVTPHILRHRGEAACKEDIWGAGAPNYNFAPTTLQPVARVERDSAERELVLMRWGLVPFFAKSLADFKGFSPFNARAEFLLTSATWREPFKKRRCLVPVDGFYEWKKLDDSKKPATQPYAISLQSGSQWPLPDCGTLGSNRSRLRRRSILGLQSFSIITTEANETMSTIHTRMPAILPERDWQEWLDRDDARQPPVHLLRPYDSDEMTLAPCNRGVGNVRNNGPEMLNSAWLLERAKTGTVVKIECKKTSPM